MKSTGIIRRIDELGRIVIPKEIRNSLRLKSGESLEIFVTEEIITMRKFSMMNKISDLAQELTDAMHTFMKNNIVITDLHTIIAASGELKKHIINKNISTFLSEKIEKREKMLESYLKEIEIIENEKYSCSYVTNPIIKDGECIGLILIFSKENKLSIEQLQISNIVSSFISRYLEE